MICPECKKDINKEQTKVLVLPSGGWCEKGYCALCKLIISDEYEPDGKIFKQKTEKAEGETF